MIDGNSTIARFALEDGLLGAVTGDVFDLPGRVRIAATHLVKAEVTRLDIFRRTDETIDVHKAWAVETIFEFGFNQFIRALFGMHYPDQETEETDEHIFNRYWMRGDHAGTFARMWIGLDDGTTWKIRGMAMTALDLDITPRQAITMNCSFVALELEQVEAATIPEATATITHKPIAAGQASLHSSDDPDAEPSEMLVPGFQAQIGWRQEFDPAQFGWEGRASRYRRGPADVAGNLLQLNSLAGYLLEGSLEMTHMIQIDEPDSGDWVRFWFVKTLTRISRQETLEHNTLHHLLQFSSEADDSTGNAKMEWRRERVLEPFDFAVIRYIWTEDGGTDLDTRTALVDSGLEWDNQDVGWARAIRIPDPGEILPGCAPSGAGTEGAWIIHGGDNCENGVEAILVDFQALADALPGQRYIYIRLRCFWYGTRNSGDMTLQFQTYDGGTMAQVGYDFINTGGADVQVLEKPRNVTVNISENTDGQNVGILRYDTHTRIGAILDPDDTVDVTLGDLMAAWADGTATSDISADWTELNDLATGWTPAAGRHRCRACVRFVVYQIDDTWEVFGNLGGATSLTNAGYEAIAQGYRTAGIFQIFALKFYGSKLDTYAPGASDFVGTTDRYKVYLND